MNLENMLNIKESRARELLRYSVENNILEKLGKTRNIKYVKKYIQRKNMPLSNII